MLQGESVSVVVMWHNKAYILFKSWKMMQKLGEKGLWKLAVYFTYLCAQVLILGTLMLTTTSMLAHTIMMVLTIALYFAVCFKDPGTYAANPEPNLEDISNKKSRSDVKQKDKKKIVSEQIRDKDLSDMIKEEDHVESPVHPRHHKKISIEEGVLKQEQLDQIDNTQPKEPSNHTLQVSKPEVNIVASAKNIFNVAKNALGNFTNFMSKKNIDQAEEEKSNIKEPQKSARSIEQDKPYVINVIKTSQEKESQQQREVEEDMHMKHEVVVAPSQRVEKKRNGPRTMAERMQEKPRYCRICEFYQPMRVRHCHSCEVCVSTFDHHCPWLSTCIGEKNKLVFIGYLFSQTLQFLVITIELIKYLSADKPGQASVGILLLAVILILIVLVLLLAFHIYLAIHNLTTWQLFRWDKIEYLCLFDKKTLRSPFSQGWKQNLKSLWTVSLQEAPRKWEEGIPQSLSKFLVKGKGSGRSLGGATERKMFLSQGNI